MIEVFKATRDGQTCHFGDPAGARAWAGEHGTVERIELRDPPDLRMVPTADPLRNLRRWCWTEDGMERWQDGGGWVRLDDVRAAICPSAPSAQATEPGDEGGMGGASHG